MKTLFLMLVIVTAGGACAAKKTVATRPMPSEEVYFGFARDRIKASESEKLDGNVSYLKATPGKMVIVEGHTDPAGSPQYNLELGDRRARTVKAYFISQGVKPEQIIVVSYGEERLKDAGRPAANRRAVIKDVGR